MKLNDITEAAITQPTAEQVERYVNQNFYVYDDEPGKIVVEDSYRRVRGKYEIRYTDSHVSVYPDYFAGDKNINRMMDNRAKQIQIEILRNASTFTGRDDEIA